MIFVEENEELVEGVMSYILECYNSINMHYNCIILFSALRFRYPNTKKGKQLLESMPFLYIYLFSRNNIYGTYFIETFNDYEEKKTISIIALYRYTPDTVVYYYDFCSLIMSRGMLYGKLKCHFQKLYDKIKTEELGKRDNNIIVSIKEKQVLSPEHYKNQLTAEALSNCALNAVDPNGETAAHRSYDILCISNKYYYNKSNGHIMQKKHNFY
jgi:hypothetical protein